MGVVYRATDRLTGKIIALKQIHLPIEYPDFASHPNSTTNHILRVALAKEFQNLAGLRHPHIISVLDYGFDLDRNPYFTMSYLPDAQTILDVGTVLDVTGKITLIRQVLQALAYLHRQGIIHRDLKPNNILVSDKTVKVVDFGLSQHQEENMETAGSLLYMAPELLRREAASKASDLYAVGVVAYQLFAGQHPFDTTSSGFAQQVQLVLLNNF